MSGIASVLSGARTAHIEVGDALEVLRAIPTHSLDALVTDPPAGIAFMGAEWDKNKGGRRQWIDWLASIMAEALRVVKPGAHALVWALPRTSHWTATALEDAGWEIRDCIVHMQGQGFPKHEGALKPASEHWWLARAPLSESSIEANVKRWGTGLLSVDECRIAHATINGGNLAENPHLRAPKKRSAPVVTCFGREGDESALTSSAGRWPPNAVFSHADGCERVGERKVKGDHGGEFVAGRAGNTHAYGAATVRAGHRHVSPDGTETVDDWRCVEGCPVAELAAQSGERKSGSRAPGVRKGVGYGGVERGDGGPAIEASEGTAARFFPQFAPDAPEPLSDLLAFPFIYASKTRRTERNAGCDALPKRPQDSCYGDGLNSATKVRTEAQAAEGVDRGTSANHHPTVKPLALMRWFVRLVTPAGGVVLDMFGGSGSTGCAAVLEGRRVVLIEREEDFAAIARARVAHWSDKHSEEPAPVVAAAPAPSVAPSCPAAPPRRQLALFDAEVA